MTTLTFSRVQEQCYPVDSEYSNSELALLEAIEALEQIDRHPGWDEDGDIAIVATELKRIQSALDEGWDELFDLGYSYRELSAEVRSELAAIEITDTDPDGNVIVVGYCNPFLGEPAESEIDEF